MDHHRLRKYRGPETWARVREAYVAGEPAPSVARRFDVGLSNLRRRALAEGWTRRATALKLDLKPIRGAADNASDRQGLRELLETDEVESFVPVDQAIDRATRKAAWLVSRGRGAEASALLKAVSDLRRVREEVLPQPLIRPSPRP